MVTIIGASKNVSFIQSTFRVSFIRGSTVYMHTYNSWEKERVGTAL